MPPFVCGSGSEFLYRVLEIPVLMVRLESFVQVEIVASVTEKSQIITDLF